MSRTFRLYDTMSKTVKELKPSEPEHLRFYSCGPTVYSFAHIGNFRTFLTADLIVRTAKALGWKVTYASNITDVGHLTQDDQADAGGEDKMARALSSKEGAQFNNVWELAEHYEDCFIEDWARLNLVPPTIRPRATQHMKEQIEAISDLIKQGKAYETPTGVYFSVASFPEYGKLSGNKQDDLMTAVREIVQDDNKRDPRDFALWKKDDKHLMQWYSPWGWGFPGWHLECSCMARAYLGDTIDLHGGGEDLVFPHHECEIAQSESMTGQPFCGHWVHTRFLQVDGEKMAKSKGNYYTVRDLVNDKGVNPLALRFALISTPYGRPFNFTLQLLSDCVKHVNRIQEAEKKVAEAIQVPVRDFVGSPNPEFQRLYDEALDALTDDLNTSVALAKLLEGIKAIMRDSFSTPSDAFAAAWFLNKMEDLLGLIRGDYSSASDVVVQAELKDDQAERIESLILARAEAKKARDFARADAIRAQLDDEGIELRDSPTGTTWVRKSAI